MSNFASYENLEEIMPKIRNVKVMTANTRWRDTIIGFKNFLDDMEAEMSATENRYFYFPELGVNIQPASGKYISFNFPGADGFSPIMMKRMTSAVSGLTDYDGKYVGVKVTTGLVSLYNVLLRVYKYSNGIVAYITNMRNVECGISEYTWAYYPDSVGVKLVTSPTIKIGIGTGSAVPEEINMGNGNYYFNIENNPIVSYLDGNDLRFLRAKCISRKAGGSEQYPHTDTYLYFKNFSTQTVVWNLSLGGDGLYKDIVEKCMNRYLMFDSDAQDLGVTHPIYEYQYVLRSTAENKLRIGDETKYPIASNGYATGDYDANVPGLFIPNNSPFAIEIK